MVQVAPIKPTLKAPGTKRLKLEFDELLSNFAFNFNTRRCRLGAAAAAAPLGGGGVDQVLLLAGAYTLHLSAQRKRFWWDKGYLGGVQGVLKAGVEGCSGV